MALKRGLGVLNTPGTIDSNYTGEVCIIAVNLSNSNIVIEDGERIAQAVLCPVFGGWATELTKVDDLNKVTERGSDGFNSTGSK
jgi:dUTP pyrophosphatase